MSIREGQNSRRVSFDTREELGNKIDKLAVMIGKLAAKDSGSTNNLNHKYIKVEVEVQVEATVKEIVRIGIGQTIEEMVETDDNLGKMEVGTDLSKIIGETIEKIQETMVDKVGEKNTETNNYRNDRCRNRSRERSFSRSFDNNRTRSISNSRSRSGSRASTNRDRIRCYKCREYDHFTRDCPTSREEREIEQLQQMLDLEGNQTSLLTNSQNSTVESPRVHPLTL